MARRPVTHPDSGLTLLELVITLAVVGVLGALTLPGLGTQLERQRLRHAAQTLAGDIAEARYLSAQRGQTLHVTALDSEPWCWAVAQAGGCNCHALQSCSIHAVAASDHPSVKLLSPLTVRLDPSGTPDAPASTVFQSRGGDQLRVEVSALGRSRVCAVKGHWPQLPAC